MTRSRTYTEGIDGYHGDGKQIVDDAMVHVEAARSETRESVELLVHPDVIDHVHILNLFLRHGLLMILCIDLIVVEDGDEVDIVGECTDEGENLDTFHYPIDSHAILFAVNKLDRISSRPEVASSWP